MSGGGDPGSLDSGCYPATVFADVTETISHRRRSSGQCFLTHLLNDTGRDASRCNVVYGLAERVWFRRAQRHQMQHRTGTYGINWYAFDPAFTAGGYRTFRNRPRERAGV